MCEANVDAPSHVAKPSTNTQMTAPLHRIAHKRVSTERHRVVMRSRRCDVPRGSSHLRGRGSWHLACSPSLEVCSGRRRAPDTMAGAAVQGAELEGCERWNVLLERRWRHDMPRYDRSRKHGAKRFDRRWMREVMSNVKSMGHVTVRPLVCFPTGVRRVKQTLLSDHHRDGPSPTARTRTNATGWDLPSGQLLASHHCSCGSHATRHRLCGGASTYESDCGER
jgi:hypothetical protein